MNEDTTVSEEVSTEEAVAEPAVEQTTDTTTSEEQTTETKAAETSETEVGSTPEAPEAPEGISERAQRRFSNLTDKVKSTAEENALLRSQLAQRVAPQQEQPSEDLPFKEGEEITLDDIRKYGEQQAQTGQSSVMQEINALKAEAAKDKFLGQWQADQDYIRKSYPELDETSDDYDDELAALVVEEIEDEVMNKVNPNIRGKVDKMMKVAKIKARDAAIQAAKNQPQGTTVSSGTVKGKSGSIAVNSDWIKNEYNPRNPEHVKAVDAYNAKLFS